VTDDDGFQAKTFLPLSVVLVRCRRLQDLLASVVVNPLEEKEVVRFGQFWKAEVIESLRSVM